MLVLVLVLVVGLVSCGSPASTASSGNSRGGGGSDALTTRFTLEGRSGTQLEHGVHNGTAEFDRAPFRRGLAAWRVELTAQNGPIPPSQNQNDMSERSE